MGKGQGIFGGVGVPSPYHPFLVLGVWFWPLVGVLFNMLM